jgi:lysophospholipase L1-like esterase
VALALVAPAALHAAPAVLLVGDSWARFVYTDASLSTVLTNHSHSEITVYGDSTTINGSTAADWTQASNLQLLDDAFTAHPNIDVVVMFLGGNDFLAGQPGGGWYVGMDATAEQQLFDDIQADLALVIDHLLALNPNLEIVLSSYDYPNFVDTLGGIIGVLYCKPQWDDLNDPTPIQINTETPRLDVVQAALASTRPTVVPVAHWGLMQYLFGFSSPYIAPGVLLPPGDPTKPSPIAAMGGVINCFHLSPTGYEGIAERLWQRALEWHYDGTFADGFESGDLIAWDAVGAAP